MGEENITILNLGCGYVRFDNCINIDCRKECNPDLVLDIKKLPYGIDSIDGIYCLDALEHIPRNLIVSTLNHWYNILKPGAFLILRLPNLKRIARKYLDGKIDCNEFSRLVYGGQEKNDLPNFHNSGFDVKTLTELLIKIGFKETYDTMMGIPCNDNNMKMKLEK